MKVEKIRGGAERKRRGGCRKRGGRRRGKREDEAEEDSNKRRNALKAGRASVPEDSRWIPAYHMSSAIPLAQKTVSCHFIGTKDS